ncbi:MAG: hypothetical protein KDC80_17435 [Saprospiraceae bacterium]|nr:hypothetical protein [Saprospiraceae bacterium]
MSAKNKTYSFFYRILLLGIIGSFLLNSSASLLYVSSASSNRIIKFLDFSDEPENEKEVKQIEDPQYRSDFFLYCFSTLVPASPVMGHSYLDLPSIFFEEIPTPPPETLSCCQAEDIMGINFI